MEELRECRCCLLRESGEQAMYKTVGEYVEKIPPDKRTPQDVYEKRLSLCRECDMLISGTCMKCGCYVELRAAFSDKRCADCKNVRWKEI